MMSNSDKKEKLDKFKLRVAGQPALEPPKPRPLPEEHPASLLFVGERTEVEKPTVANVAEVQSASFSKENQKDGVKDSGASLPLEPNASDEGSERAHDNITSHETTITPPASANSDVIQSTAQRQAGEQEIVSVSRAAVIKTEPDIRTQEAIRRTYNEFERRMKLILAESHIKTLRAVFENTTAINEKAYRIAGPTLAEMIGVKRRQVSNILAKLEALNLIKYSQWKEGSKDIGLIIRFTANIYNL
jgi:hypothetical protein